MSSSGAGESPSHATSSLKGILSGEERSSAGSGGGGGASTRPPGPAASAAAKPANRTDVYARRLPFTRYNGELGGLLDSLRTSAGLVSWEDNGTIYLSDTDRFSVTVPQNEDIVNEIAQTIHDLGGTEIVASVGGGKVFYSAPAMLERDTIAPFLRKAVRNMATINIQVAIVSLALTDKSGNGFDWSQLSATLGQNGVLANSTSGLAGTGALAGTAGLTGTGVTTGALGATSASNGLANAGSGIVSSSLGTTNDAFNLAASGSGKIMGVRMLGSIGTAVNYLSTFGSTNIKQNVDMRTLSGKKIDIKSEEEIPYVKSISTTLGNGVSNGSYGSSYGNGGSSLGTAQTDTVKTGLDVSMLPRFDSDNDLVMVDMRLTQSQLVQFVTLNAGSQLGTLSQPQTRRQEISDILRIRAGQTAVIGGLQVDQDQKNGNEPTALRELGSTDTSFGSRTQDVSRTALFIVMRPTVVVYDTE